MPEQSREKFVFAFEEGNRDQKFLLGGKGANLAEMTNLGLPVPPGFTITTDACKAYMALGDEMPPGLMAEVAVAREQLEKKMGKQLGDADDPLLVSVRSGAPFSMPGMMDTVLNLGLNDESVKGLAKQTQNERFAYDSYRRFVQMFGKIVLDIPGELFEEALHDLVESRGFSVDTELTADDLAGLVETFKGIVKAEKGVDFPTDPQDQLAYAIDAVFKSWNGRRARDYRRMEKIPDDLGTAVNVQTMVFGNKGEDSGTGVAFTRNPSTGENKPYGDFLKNAQGEDVVAGIRITEPLDAMGNEFPEPHQELLRLMRLLENHFRDMCDIEFTIEQGRLFMLQTRVGKRTAAAALRMAVEMVDEGLIDKTEAVLRVQPAQLDQLLHPQFDPSAKFDVLAKGLNASPGAAVGKVYFTADEAEARHEAGERVILVRPETSPDDLHGMIAAQGILTSRGGLVSHAAVVARGMGKPCVSGAGSLRVDYRTQTLTVGGTVLKKGDTLTIDGASGQVLAGAVPMLEPVLAGEFATVMKWADALRDLKVRANADTPADARAAIKFGAEGIGLCRTEHMFFDEDRIRAVREMILAEDEAARRVALAKLLPMQRGDFLALFKIMGGLPVTIRLLDPPLHEFLPHSEKEIAEVAHAMGADAQRLADRARELHEFNPMLGFRGCRLAIAYPEIAEMQARAIFEAAAEARRQTGKRVAPEIMVPLIASKREFDLIKERIDSTAQTVAAETGAKLKYQVGTMIELPRAALKADEIAETAEFFSFGTNDLTQTAFGISRDDAASFLGIYTAKGILPSDPFVSLDRDGVGELIRIASARGRKVRGKLKLGICGEHGGDPASVAFCHEVGLDYVSCSPFRVPIARLAAAQAALGASAASDA
jgi:pyruvate,orthophosphate dikinase